MGFQFLKALCIVFTTISKTHIGSELSCYSFHLKESHMLLQWILVCYRVHGGVTCVVTTELDKEMLARIALNFDQPQEEKCEYISMLIMHLKAMCATLKVQPLLTDT